MHNTGNPLGSKDILDLYDNSEVVDNFVNSQQDEIPDRFGTKRLTLAGLIKRSMALRNEINDFSGALTFRPEWSDVPMNVSEGVGGEGGALNLQAEALGNRTEINKITSREVLRRTYLEAGLNLVPGSFEAGAVITSTTDVVLHEKTGKCYSGPVGEVPKGTDPLNGDFVGRSQSILRQKTALYGTVADIFSGVYAVGSRITVTDRDMATFVITSGGTPDGYGVLAAGEAKTAVIVTGGTATIKSFGAKGDGVTDDTGAIQAAVDATWNAGGGVVYAPGGVYLVTATIDLYKGSAKPIRLTGVGGSGVTKFITMLDIVVFQHAEFTTFTDFRVEQTGVARTGRAFSTPTSKQAAYCTYKRIGVSRFKFGIWWRFSLWCALRDVTFTNCAVGVKASRNSSPDDQTNPANTGGWNNWTTGFFHNQNTFQNLLCEGGEVGIWGTFQGTTFDNVTCQGQRSPDGSANVAAPVGTPGIGLWLQNDGNGTSTYGSQGNNIVSYYTEATRQPMVFEYVKVALSAFFAQGGTTEDPYPQVIKVTGGEVNALGCSASGADWFTKHLVLTNCRVLGDVQVGAVNGSVSSVTNSVWQQKITTPAKNFNLNHSGAATTAIETLANRSTYTVVVGGLNDGYIVKSAQFEVFHFRGGYTRVMAHPNNSPDITCTVSGDTLNLNTTGTATYLIHGTVIRNNALGQYPYTAS